MHMHACMSQLASQQKGWNARKCIHYIWMGGRIDHRMQSGLTILMKAALANNGKVIKLMRSFLTDLDARNPVCKLAS
jgi:hypothetical protein